MIDKVFVRESLLTSLRLKCFLGSTCFSLQKVYNMADTNLLSFCELEIPSIQCTDVDF